LWEKLAVREEKEEEKEKEEEEERRRRNFSSYGMTLSKDGIL
jgi:hypothetical protein